MRANLLTFLFLLVGGSLFGQLKPQIDRTSIQAQNYTTEDIGILRGPSSPQAPRRDVTIQLWEMEDIQQLQLEKRNARITRDAHSGQPLMIEGPAAAKGLVTSRSSQIENEAFNYLQSYRQELRIQNAEQEFRIKSIEEEENGQRHVRFQQYHHGVEVYGGELVLHSRNDVFSVLNGRSFPSPRLEKVRPDLSQAQAGQRALSDLASFTTVVDLSSIHPLLDGQQISKQRLVIMPGTTDRLLWYQEVAANPLDRYAYLIDAHTGEVFRKYSLVCQLHPELGEGHTHHTHGASIDWKNFAFSRKGIKNEKALADGPTTATAQDMFGRTQQINVYELGGTQFMLDAVRPMYNAGRSSLPDEPAGGILTASGQDTSPAGEFNPNHVLPNNQNAWDKPDAVSAHLNAGIAYEYFRQKHGRNSINGQGGTILSFVRVADEDGKGMDNAFWNGSAMFYGSGRDAFFPLAAALDVAAHEMTHGVIQNAANLEYYGESGALNESFADIFGVLIDSDDWQLGEDVVKEQYFPSGALRDMQNPNNGGRKLGDAGWQPASVSEQYFGDLDNGGVHINSGINNRAFYLFATQVGKDVAEKVYYRALTRYLTRSSQFIDCRLAVIQAATDNYGTDVINAAKAAYDAVGITGDTTPTEVPQDVDANPGEQIIAVVGQNNQGLYFLDENAEVYSFANPLIDDQIISKPSISDNGSFITYVTGNNQIRGIEIDWQSGKVEPYFVSEERVWRNAAVSKDGFKLAAVTTDYDDRVLVYDFNTDQAQFFSLYNPTTAQGGFNSEEVVYADALEWDLTSTYITYDALNEYGGLFSQGVSYWDIGFLRAWDPVQETFGDGLVEKLFQSLPEGITIGFPSFAKNSPTIMTFDVWDEVNDEYSSYTSNFETGDLVEIVRNSQFGTPNYTIDDRFILLTTDEEDGSQSIYFIPLEEDKLTPSGDPQRFIKGAIYPVAFATGQRVLTDNDDIQNEALGFQVFPNPTTGQLSLGLQLEESMNVTMRITDLFGKTLRSEQFRANSGVYEHELQLEQLPAGTYLIYIQAGNTSGIQKIVKM